jgi:hypothetical protein
MEEHLDCVAGCGEEGRAVKTSFVAIALAGALGLAMLRPAGDQQPISLSVKAPELVGGSWLNTPDRKSIKLADRKGKVTIVEFWTFG